MRIPDPDPAAKKSANQRKIINICWVSDPDPHWIRFIGALGSGSAFS